MPYFGVHCRLGDGSLKVFEIQPKPSLGTVGMHSNDDGVVAKELTAAVAELLGLKSEYFYLTHNGNLLSDCSNQLIFDRHDIPLVLVPRLLGGKGGFGSMLRAIGAQIEKTTNREACRDLSGRRLRDINEEQRVKKWFAKQKEREQEKEEMKKKKLEKLRRFCEGAPLPLTQDPEYNLQRAEMADSVFEAVDKGFEAAKEEMASVEKASTSTSSTLAVIEEEASSSSTSADGSAIASTSSSASASAKKVDEAAKEKQTIIKRTFFEEDLDSDVSDSESDEEAPAKKAKI